MSGPAGPPAAREHPGPAVEARAECPVRTCIGCRGKAPLDALVRLVALPLTSAPAEVHGVPRGGEHEDGTPRRPGTRVVLDPARRLPGRGAHLHPDAACVERAVQRRAIPRALRLPGNVDLSEVIEWADRLTTRTGRREEQDMEAGNTR
ncbi:YlxR family protein [Kytococcus sedentarius]|uniref:YlxR family protein n=1 Tax=Kytococcus sedentarius TaxID=1276 RepID=UPI0035BC7A32